MHVLCFHSNNVSSSHAFYVDYLRIAYPKTIVDAGSHQHLLQVISSMSFDIVLLFCDDRSLLSVSRIRQAAIAIRANQPTCLIMIHRYSRGGLTRLFRSIPEELCDFSFDRYLNPVFLPRFARTLWFRRQNLWQLKEQPHNLKGIVAVEERLGQLLMSRLTNNDIQVCLIDVTEGFENQFRHQFPDFVMLHCHNRKGDFEIVKRTTHLIRTIHPACLIYLTCTMIVLDDYDSPYRYDEYLYDALLIDPISKLEVLTHINRSFGLWYHIPSLLP